MIRYLKRGKDAAGAVLIAPSEARLATNTVSGGSSGPGTYSGMPDSGQNARASTIRASSA